MERFADKLREENVVLGNILKFIFIILFIDARDSPGK